MKKYLVFALVLSSFAAMALPIAYEGFDYALTPTNLVGHTNPDGFTRYQAGPVNGGTNIPSINPGNLTTSGLAPSIGNSAKFGGFDSAPSGMAARFSRSSGSLATSGTIYYSFILQLTDITGLSASGFFFAGFNNSAGAQAGVPSAVATRLNARAVPEGGYQLGMEKSSGQAGNFQWAPEIYYTSNVHFIVGSYTFNTGSTTDDVSQMWVNPDPANFGATSPPTTNLLSATLGNDYAGIASFCIFNRNVAEPRGIILDELTLGTSWADVTPTASSMAIVTQPNDQRAMVGNSAAFNVETFRATIYQWQRNGVNIPGATLKSLALNDVQLADAGSYRVVVGNGVTTQTSSDAVLTVYADVYPRLAPLWSIAPFSRPYITTDAPQLPMQRHFAYNALSNQVLIVSRTNTSTLASTGMVYVLDAATGADLYEMNADSGVISGGLNGATLSSIDVAEDGAVYAANISDATTAIGFKLYRWENSGPSAAPVNVYDGDPFGLGTERFGDSLAVRGTNINTQVLLSDARGLYAALLLPQDGTMTTFSPAPFTNVMTGSTGGRTLLFDTGDTFWEKHRQTGLRLASFDTVAYTSTLITNYNNFPSSLGVAGFNFGLNLLCGVNSLDATNAPDSLDLFDISNPSLPVLVASYNFPTNSQANPNRCGRVIFSDDKIYALDANNGIMAFVVTPRLSLASAGTDIVLSWQTNYTGYTLQASPSLPSPTTWTNVGTGTIASDRYSVTTTPSASSLFYRLKR